jgi:hypothetical protein
MQRLQSLVMLVSWDPPDALLPVQANKTIVTHVLLETGAEELRAIEEKVYVGSGRFIVENGKPTVVEYLISEVVSGV